MNKQINKIELLGEVTEALPNTTFRVKVDGEERVILCHLAGKMRIYRIKVMIGDKVRFVMTPYDNQKGRIITRL